MQEAAKTPTLQAKSNGGHPAIAATPQPSAFHATGVVAAKPPAPTSQPAVAHSTVQAETNNQTQLAHAEDRAQHKPARKQEEAAKQEDKEHEGRRREDEGR
jgi:hypothetical protein